jgi:phosphonate transport system ATP-binding protein
MNNPEPVFELKNVSKRFGDFQALRDISLQIRDGERVALVGPSGAGKSTLINLLNGTMLPSQGQVRVLGQDLTRTTPWRASRTAAVVFGRSRPSSG